MIYAYKCRTCGHRDDSTTRADTLGACPNCPGLLTRDYSGIAMQRPMQEHFNKTLGRPVSDMGQFKRELSRLSDEYTARTGIESRFVPTDPTDTKALGVTEEGLDSTNRRRVAQGQKPIKLP